MEIKISEMPTFAAKFYTTGLAMIMRSAPGIGKTSLARQVCELLAHVYQEPVGFIVRELPGLSDVDARGILSLETHSDNAKRAIWSIPDYWPTVSYRTSEDDDDDGFGTAECYVPDPERRGHGEWRKDMPMPKRGIILIDEFSAGGQDVQKVMSTLVLERRINSFHLPEGWVVWLASNRTQDRSGVGRGMAHLDNRMMQIQVTNDPNSYRLWAEINGVGPVTISFAQKFPLTVFSGEVPEEEGPFCSPRSITLMDKTLRALGDDPSGLVMPTDAIATAACAGWIGDGAAAEYMTFAKVMTNVPDLAEVEDDPMGVTVPKAADLLFVISYYLAGQATVDNITPLSRYVDRLPTEYAVGFWRAGLANNYDLTFTEEYSTFNAKHGDLLLAIQY